MIAYAALERGSRRTRQAGRDGAVLAGIVLEHGHRAGMVRRGLSAHGRSGLDSPEWSGGGHTPGRFDLVSAAPQRAGICGISFSGGGASQRRAG